MTQQTLQEVVTASGCRVKVCKSWTMGNPRERSNVDRGNLLYFILFVPGDDLFAWLGLQVVARQQLYEDKQTFHSF